MYQIDPERFSENVEHIQAQRELEKAKTERLRLVIDAVENNWFWILIVGSCVVYPIIQLLVHH